MKRITTLLLFYFIIVFCKGQVATDSTSVFIEAIDEESRLLQKTQLFIDSSSSLSIAEVVKKDFFSLESLKSRRKLTANLYGYTFYLKIFIDNKEDHEVSAYLFPGAYFRHFEIYKIDSKLEKLNITDSFPGYGKISLAPRESGYIIAVLKPIKNEFNYISPLLINADFIKSYKTYIVGHKSDIQLYGIILSGVLLMMILFMLTNYIISKKSEFLYNAMYSLCMFLLIFLSSVLTKNSSVFTNLFYSYLDFFLLVTGTAFYITFTRKFLNTKNNYLFLDRILKYGEQFFLALLGIYTYLHFFTSTFLPQYYLEIFMKFFILAIGSAFIYLAFKRKNRLFNYIAAGNAVLVIFSTISLLLIVLKIKPTEIYYSALFYYNTGIVFELSFFLLGLTYKNRSELITNIKEQEALKQEAEKFAYETEITVMKAQQEERNRISADMHDDLGAGMTTIRLYSELAKSKMANNPMPEINKISHSANELLNKMNAIIWSMSSSNDSLSNTIAYIRSYALEYFEDSGIICKTNIPENLPNIQVSGEIRRNVFLVVKEALNNVLKHSGASEVTLTLEKVEDGLKLYIQDNGAGIHLDKIRQFGNGLKNMKKRMTDVDIEFSIENKNGTLLTLHRKITSF